MADYKWVADNASGDLMLVCNGKRIGGRIPKSVIDATSGQYDMQQSIVLEKLKKLIEKQIGCFDGED